jgi:polyisoprenoid-binding protein YceI
MFVPILNSQLLRKPPCRLCAGIIFLFLVALLASPRLSAQETVVTLDPAQTRIEYALGATLHEVHGTFRLKSGVIHFDPATGKASGSIVVDATSGNSGNDGRDSKMHREILESPKYPEIVFVPAQVKGVVNAQGASQVEVSPAYSASTGRTTTSRFRSPFK